MARGAKNDWVLTDGAGEGARTATGLGAAGMNPNARGLGGRSSQRAVSIRTAPIDAGADTESSADAEVVWLIAL